MVVRVQQMMRLFTAGGAQIITIKNLNLRVVVRKTEWIFAVVLIQDLPAFRGLFFIVVDGLPAAARTTAGAGHDLYKIILYLALANGADELARMALYFRIGLSPMLWSIHRYISVS